MIILLQPQHTPQQLETIIAACKAIKYKPTTVTTQYHAYIVATGTKAFDIRLIGTLPGVQDVFAVTDSFQLVSSMWRTQPTTINLGDNVTISPTSLSLAAGPCSIESEEQVESIVQHLVANGITIMRGGVFKPRSSPYAFRGLGIPGLQMFHAKCQAAGIKIVTEVMQVSQIEEMHPYVDIFQVGARNTQNFNLLDELGKAQKPVLLKRGISGTIEELLQSAEYIFSGGNEQIILCERGIRTFEPMTRNTLDINAIPILKTRSHLPVFVDPSHGIGIRQHVPAIARAAVAAGADGIIYEVHPQPEEAASDGAQTLSFVESTALSQQLRTLHALVNTFQP